MQNIITLGQINDALKFTTVTAAQLAEMGFAALANKPICEALPQEEARRLRTAKLYPAESIGQIRVTLAKRLAAPASCLHQIQEPAPVLAAQPVVWPKSAQDVRDFFRSDFITAQFAAEDQSPCDEDRYLISAHDFLSAVRRLMTLAQARAASILSATARPGPATGAPWARTALLSSL